MSRSGYSDSIETWSLIMWRGAVASALHGRRGQAFLKEMLAALNNMTDKRLIKADLQDEYDPSCVCALGAVGRARGLDMSTIDPEVHEDVADEFAIAHAMACEIMDVNDDQGSWNETAEQRYWRVHNWVTEHIRVERKDHD